MEAILQIKLEGLALWTYMETPMRKPDPRLIELFEYHFGIDLTQEKYQEGLAELAYFFNDVLRKSVNDFMTARLIAPTPDKQEEEIL